MTKHNPVTFLDSEGNTISNDPLYLAQQRLADAGVETAPSVNMDELRAQIRAEIEAERASENSENADDDSDDDSDDEYSKLDGKALKALAKERGIEIPAEVKTVGALRDLLRQTAGE